MYVMFIGWNRPIPGREQMSAEHFGEMMGYLAGLQGSGSIHSFETVLLDPHGGDLNGFFLIRGDQQQLFALQSSEAWQVHTARADNHLAGLGVISGVSDETAMGRVALLQSALAA